jgi:hypothetical protein
LILQEQPFQILAALLERPGHLVTHDELRRRLWSYDTFVDFERSLNKAVNRLREVLEESVDQPRFIARHVVSVAALLWSPSLRCRYPKHPRPLLQVTPEALILNTEGIAKEICKTIFAIHPDDLADMIKQGMTAKQIAFGLNMSVAGFYSLAQRLGGVQRICNLDTHRQNQLGFHWAASDSMRHAVQKFHDDERMVPVFADLVNGANVGMVQSGSTRASRRKRSKVCGSWARPSGKNFRATKRPSSVSSAL